MLQTRVIFNPCRMSRAVLVLHSGWCVSRRALCRGGVAATSDVQREWKEKNAKQDTTQPASNAERVMSKVIRGKPDPFSPRALGKMYLWGLSKQKRLSGHHLTPTLGPSLVDSSQRSHRLHRNQVHLAVNAPCIGPLGGDLAVLGRRHSEESPSSPGGIRSKDRTV